MTGTSHAAKKKQQHLVPITREFLREFYRQYPLEPVPGAVRDSHVKAIEELERVVTKPGSKVPQEFYMETPTRIDDCFWRSRMICEVRLVHNCGRRKACACVQQRPVTHARAPYARPMLLARASSHPARPMFPDMTLIVPSQELALSISRIKQGLAPAGGPAAVEVAAVCDRMQALLVQAERDVWTVQETNTASVRQQLKQFIPQDFRGALLERQR